MQPADAFRHPLSQQQKLNVNFSKLHVVLISRDKNIELHPDVHLLCQIIIHPDHQNLTAITRFKKIDAICLDSDSLGAETFEFLKKRSHHKALASIPVILVTTDTKRPLEIFTDGNIQDYYSGCLKNPLFTFRFKNFIELHCIKTDSNGDSEESFDLAFMAYYDQLTSLPNRQLFQARVEDKINQITYDVSNFAVLFLDLDGFKLINDENDHRTGDWLLNQVGIRLKNCLKRTDTVARLGGDEFGVMLDQIDSKMTVEKIAQRIVYRLGAPYNHKGHSLKINVSIGVALFPQTAKTYNTLVHKADRAMYEAKRKGKGQVVFFEQ